MEKFIWLLKLQQAGYTLEEAEDIYENAKAELYEDIKKGIQKAIQILTLQPNMHMEHYNIYKFDTIDVLKGMFPNSTCDNMNWVIFSTSGVHGTYTTLDDIERDGEGRLTVTVLQPRKISIAYGEIEVTKEDVPFLRKLAQSTLQAFKESQEGNY